MITSILTSFKDSISQKATNPFLGTYLGVWLLRNWDLVYAVFNFDKGDNLQTRLAYIDHYYSHYPFLKNLVCNIAIAFGVLLATYLVLGVSRIIVKAYNEVFTPFLSKLFDKTSIVTRERHQLEVDANTELEDKIDEIREDKSKLQAENIKYEKENEDLKIKIRSQENAIEENIGLKNYKEQLELELEKKESSDKAVKLEWNKSLGKISALEKTITSYKEDLISVLKHEEYLKQPKELRTLLEKIKSKRKLEYTPIPLVYPPLDFKLFKDSEVIDAVEYLDKNNLIEVFKTNYTLIKQNIGIHEDIHQSELINFVNLGLIRKIKHSVIDVYYSITSKGKTVYEYIENE